MAKADLHVHSRFSARPSEWFLQRLGTRESYTTPDKAYGDAKSRGMNFVTITDHNEIAGSLILKEKYPESVFTGTELTTYFPEDGCKIHLLVYGITEEQFCVLDKLRPDIYQLRDYIKEQQLAHSVAHATYDINHKLTFAHLEKLILLFDIFEGINGSRSKLANIRLMNTLSLLTPDRIYDLYRRYKIEPFSQDSWIKGITGGSDDHGGLFIGNTYTAGHGETVEEFVETIKNKQTFACGRHNDFRGLAFAIYKVAYDFSRTRSGTWPTSMFNAVNALIFDQDSLGFRNRIVLQKMKRSKTAREDSIKKALLDLVNAFQKNKNLKVETKLSMVYDRIADIADSFFVNFITGLEKDLKNSDLIGMIRTVSTSIPGIFLSLPFFTAFNELHRSRNILSELSSTYETPTASEKKILWFSDTINDLNGVAETLKKLGWITFERNLPLTIAACVLDEDRRGNLPPNMINLPCIHTYNPSYFDSYTLRVPSALKSLKMIYDQDPDEIYISTPGPVGMLGLLAAQLLHVPCHVVYHTDFTRQAQQIIGDETVSRIVEDATRWFHCRADFIHVPTRQYMDLLEQRNFDRKKMHLFHRGIEKDVFTPQAAEKDFLRKKYGVESGITLLYAGRISKEKNLDFLADVYDQLVKKYDRLNLVMAGDGPYMKEFQQKMSNYPRAHLLGRIDRKELAAIYSNADCFVFPSTTDTFGMVILEAQACGLPAVVSDFGGPQEIVINGKTGYIANTNNSGDWVRKISMLVDTIRNKPEEYRQMRSNAHQNIETTYSWDTVLENIFGCSKGEKKEDKVLHTQDAGQENDFLAAV